jgi:hypothetical protein
MMLSLMVLSPTPLVLAVGTVALLYYAWCRSLGARKRPIAVRPRETATSQANPLGRQASIILPRANSSRSDISAEKRFNSS